ncbi:MAG: tetratricopeptide repeat protein [bacterium]|nr:tetratricopeptide repeat protein [bacterium]
MKLAFRLIKPALLFNFVLAWNIVFQTIGFANKSFGMPADVEDKNKDARAQYQEIMEEMRKIEYATQCARKAAEAFADSAFLPELLFNLSEWEVQREKLRFEIDMMKYDQQLLLFENGKLSSEPSEPHLTYDKTLKINRQIVEKFPDYPYFNKVLYRNAICLYEIGKKDSAKQLFTKLVSQYPDSSYLAEVVFRLGECHFDEGNYQLAINTYKNIVPAWHSPFFAMALYKIGWCYYRLNNFSDAISHFYYLLNDISLIEQVDSDVAGKSQVELKDEIIEHIALCFSDFGGASSLYQFVRSVEGSNYAPSLLHRLGNIFLKRDFYEDALDAFDHLSANFGYYQKLPDIFPLIFKCYEKMGDMEKAYQLHDQLVKSCGPQSKWAQLNSSQENVNLFNSTLTDIDYKIAEPLIIQADSIFASKNYQRAIDKYSKFLKLFEKDTRAHHAQYCLAECYYNLNDFANAANCYKELITRFPKSELREDAGYNHIVCFDQIYQEKNSNNQNSNVPLKQNKEIKNLIGACDNFLKWFPKSDKEPEIKLKLAEIFYRNQLYSLGEKYARSALVSIIKFNRGKQCKTNALNLLAQLSFKQEKYRNTEVLSSLLIKENPDSLELIEKSKTMLASTTYKIGEQLKSKGQITQAAKKFEEAAMSAPDPQIAEASLFESAVQYEEAKQIRRAAMNFEQFFKKYPKSERAKESLYRAALLQEKLEQYHLAARDYLELNMLASESPEGTAALFNAGLAYEKAKDWFSMAETFKKYVTKYPTDNENMLEVLFKIGFAYEQKNMLAEANIQYQKLLTKYDQLKASGEFADDFFAANAAFQIAELKQDKFKTIKLTPPFQANLKRKQQAFNDMLKSYVEATKFNVADWSTAAFYRIGLAYELFCQDILESPAPPNLSPDDLKTYWATINQQWIGPLQQEALKYYQTNEKLAIENNVKNDWIEKTRARILFLNKKLAEQNPGISSIDQVKEASAALAPKIEQKRQKL